MSNFDESDDEGLESLFIARDPSLEIFYFKGIDVYLCRHENHENDSLEIKFHYNFAREVRKQSRL